MKSIAKAVAGYGHPQKGRGAEKASLSYQLGRLTENRVDPSPYYAKAVELMLPFYPAYHAPELDDESIRKRLWFLMNFRLVPDSSPGFPFSVVCSKTSDAIRAYAPLILEIAFKRIKFYLDNDLCDMSVVERLVQNLIDIWKMHTKEEPHPVEKIREGRSRIIFGGSLVNSLVERFFNQEYQDTCASDWLTCPSKPGIGFADDASRLFYESMAYFDKVTSDVSGWDFSVDEKLLEYGFQIRVRKCLNPSPRWVRAMSNVCFNVHHALVSFTGGLVLNIEGGIQKSGSFLTASLNSDCRNVLAISVDLRSGISEKGLPVFRYASMGDDIIQPDYGTPQEVLVSLYHDWGFRVTDVVRARSGDAFEFCSHLFRPEGAELLSSARTLFRLIHQTPSIEFLMQFCFECRHNRNLSSLLTLIFLSGWDVELPNHAIGLNVRAPSIQGMSRSAKRAARGTPPQKKVVANTSANARAVGKQVVREMPTKALQSQVQTIMDPLTLQDLAIAEYLITIGDPWVEEPAGVPILIGGATLRTVKVQQIYEGQATANASGFGFVAVNTDTWVADNNGHASYVYSSYSGGTEGYPIWYSGATYVGTTLPVNTITTATAGVLAIQKNLLDGQVTSLTDIRCVAAGLEVFSDAAAQTAQGKLAVVATTKPFDVAANGAIVGSTYSTLSGMPQDLLSFQTRPCAGWRAGSSMKVVAIPNDSQNFEMCFPVAVGRASFGYPQLAAILSGAAANQTFTWRIVYDYEFSLGKTYVTGVQAQPVFGSDQSALMGAVGNFPSPTSVGPMGQFTGKGVQGLVNHLAVTRPNKLLHLNQLATGAAQGANSGAGGGISNLFSQGLKWLGEKAGGAIKGIVKGIPYVGGIASMLFD